jgi:glycosyltransferase involved in cell wall biosynthesis
LSTNALSIRQTQRPQLPLGLITRLVILGTSLSMDIAYIVLFYNQEEWVEGAIRAAFEQTTHLSISFVFSDDCSTDNTLERIRKFTSEFGEGCNFVIRSNSSNLGIVEHLNVVTSDLQASFVAIVAGDDLPKRDWVDSITAQMNSNCFAGWSNLALVAASGNSIGSIDLTKRLPMDIESIVKSNRVKLPGAGAIFRSRVFTDFGPLPTSIMNEDDQTIFRACLLGTIVVVPDYLFEYRVHASSASSWLSKTFTFKKYLKLQLGEIQNRTSHLVEWKRLILIRNQPDTKSLIAKIDIHIDYFEILTDSMTIGLGERFSKILSGQRKFSFVKVFTFLFGPQYLYGQMLFRIVRRFFGNLNRRFRIFK